uniref:Uncharacterized protein n=1 Tax=Romanomermis culicivorax TaxID=13658 RepID=A0A915KGF3_ROMCU
MVMEDVFIMIKNSDNLCLARAIVVAIAILNKTDGAYQWDNICRSEGGSCSLQTQRAHDLMTRAGLQNHTGLCGIQELEIIQRTLPKYKIKTFVLQDEFIKYCDCDEAKGWPDECKDEMSKKTYLDEVTMHEGIELDPLKIDRNPG